MIRKLALWFLAALLIALPASAEKKSTPAKQTPSVTGTDAATAPAKTQAPSSNNPANAGLESVLDEMDKAAANFKTASADFVWDQYQKVVDEHDLQKGQVFFVRREKDTHMAADIVTPDKKYLVFSDGKIRFYQPHIDQVTEYDAGKNKAEVESFLVLGFGSRGHDLAKSFTVKFDGREVLDGVKVAKLELVPKSEKVRGMFEHMVLWIDPARGVSLKQQAYEPSGDFRTATYSNIRINEKIPEDVFKLKTTAKTKVVHPQ